MTRWWASRWATRRHRPDHDRHRDEDRARPARPMRRRPSPRSSRPRAPGQTKRQGCDASTTHRSGVPIRASTEQPGAWHCSRAPGRVRAWVASTSAPVKSGVRLALRATADAAPHDRHPPPAMGKFGRGRGPRQRGIGRRRPGGAAASPPRRASGEIGKSGWSPLSMANTPQQPPRSAGKVLRAQYEREYAERCDGRASYEWRRAAAGEPMKAETPVNARGHPSRGQAGE